MLPRKPCPIPECSFPEGECMNLCWSPGETRMDIIGQNGNDGDHYHTLLIETLAQKDPIRRPQSRFSAGMVDLTPPTTSTAAPNCPAADADMVNHPPHYTLHPSGVECIQITEHMGFCLGNAMKYIWRADLKNDAVEDLKKAAWYIQREIERRSR